MSYSWLPSLLREIAEVTDLDCAVKIAREKGGSRVSIPRKVTEDHWLAETVGMDNAQEICGHFSTGKSGVVLDLPLGPASNRKLIHRRMDEMLEDGMSADVIARTLGVDRTTVFRRQRRNRETNRFPDPLQDDFFL